MKHIHIVNPYRSVAMSRMTIPLIRELPSLYVVSEGQTPDDNADLNFHVPYHTLIDYEGKGKQAMLYTHCNPPDVPNLLEACSRADLIVCMSFRGRQELVEIGVDPQKLWVIYSAADSFTYRRRILGVIGFAQPNGRKRESILIDLAWRYNMTPYHFLIAGGGWEWVVERMRMLGASVQHVALADDAQLREFYNSMDALLVTGYVEGGPLPLLEAMAAGVPVISPRFGYAADLLDEHQFYDTVEELADRLEKLAEKSIMDHQLVKSWTWQDYASEHAFVFGRLLGESTQVFPKQGMDRYAQLMDIIEQVKPRSIVEIGTWNGNRAIQMIQQAAKYHPIESIQYYGYDLFEEQTGEQLRSELSKGSWPVELVQRRILATGAQVHLTKGDTRQTLRHSLIDADLYYIDGGHSEQTIENDWLEVLNAVQTVPNPVIVFDDYYHEGKPDGMGCNSIINRLAKTSDVWDVTCLPERTPTDDGRQVGMVLVRRKNARLSIQMSGRAWVRNTTSDNGLWTETNLPAVREGNVSSTTDPTGDLEERITSTS